MYYHITSATVFLQRCSKIPLLCEGDEASQVAQLDWRIIEGDIEKPFISSGLEFVPLPVRATVVN